MLAIIIPYFKLTFFRETLESLSAQTDQRFHVYIGNDASPEDPAELLKEFEGKFDFNYQKFEENLGGISLTKQWDRCIEMMQGEEWFMILGDDDYFSSNVIEVFYKSKKIIDNNNISVIKLNSAIINAQSIIQFEKKLEPLIKSAIDHFFDKLKYEGRSSLSEHIFRKSKYDQFKFFDMPLAWHSDDLALLEFSEYQNILFIKEAKCFVRISNESITGNPNKNLEQKWAASKMFFERVCQNLDMFTKEEKIKLFDLIQWHEKNKNIKVYISYKIYEYYKCYGFIKTAKLLLY